MPDVDGLIEQYRAGLEAELVLLGRLKEIASRQHETTRVADIDALQRVADQRDALMSGLLAIEHDVKSVRDQLSRARKSARQAPGFAQVVTLQQNVARLVKGILDTDRSSIQALEQIVSSRKMAAQAIERAESTLAAYGRIVAAPPPTATLVNRKG